MDYVDPYIDTSPLGQCSPWTPSQLDNPFNSDDSSQSEEPETPDSALASSIPRAGHAFLPFMDLDLWIPNIPYDENPPLYIRYTVQWKFTVNNRATAKDTRQDLAISPSDFWEADLQETIDKLIERNRRTHPSAHVYETSLTVSVNERSELDLTKRADELNIEWEEIERQLRRWSPLLRQGKRLVRQLVFKLSNKNGTAVGKRGRKRGRRSATDIMFAERASHLDAEEASTDEPSIWRRVYALMRCPGPPCRLGPHCWRDATGRHYKLNTYHFNCLIEHVRNGHGLETHADMPEDIQVWLREEAKQDEERQNGHAARGNRLGTSLAGASLAQPAKRVRVAECAPITVARFHLLGTRDENVQSYLDWQAAQVAKNELKEDFQKAGEIILDKGFDLEQLHCAQDSSFLIEQGVKPGTAYRVLSDIEYWVQHYANREVSEVSQVSVDSTQ